MGWCAVEGCQSGSKNTKKENGLICHGFPIKDPALCKTWLQLCGNPVLQPNNARICSKHFLPSDYSRDLEHELLGRVPRRRGRLLPGAVPSLLLTTNSNLTEITTRKQSTSRKFRFLCFACGCEAGSHSQQNDESQAAIKWAESCASSACKLFDLEHYLFHPWFYSANYCFSCLELIRDVDFILKSIDTLQQRLNIHRKTLSNLFETNHQSIIESTDPLKNRKTDSYDLAVKSVFNSICQIKIKVETYDESVILDIQEPENPVPIIRTTFQSASTQTVGLEIFSNTESLPYIRFKRIVTPRAENYSVDLNSTFDMQSGLLRPTEARISPKKASRTRKPKKFQTVSTDSTVVQETAPTSEKSQHEAEAFITEINESVVQPKTKSNLTSKHGKLKFKCEFEACKHRALTDTDLETHVRVVHEKDPNPYHCTEEGCNQNFKTRRKLHCHTRRHKKPSFFCNRPNCNRKFYEQYKLNAHLRMHDTNIKPVYKRRGGKPRLRCDVCHKGFSEECAAELEAHLQLHETKKLEDAPLTCVISSCDSPAFVCTFDLRRHVRLEHEMDLVVGHCPICNLGYKSKLALYYHLKRHSNSTSLKCRVSSCNFVAKDSSELTKQRCQECFLKMPRHLCSFCGKSYREKGILKAHLRKHTRETPYTCSYQGCGRAFITSNSLRSHEEHHGQLRPYLCFKCPRAFKSRNNLENHLVCHRVREERDALKVQDEHMSEHSASETPAPQVVEIESCEGQITVLNWMDFT